MKIITIISALMTSAFLGGLGTKNEIEGVWYSDSLKTIECVDQLNEIFHYSEYEISSERLDNEITLEFIFDENYWHCTAIHSNVSSEDILYAQEIGQGSYLVDDNEITLILMDGLTVIQTVLIEDGQFLLTPKESVSCKPYAVFSRS